MLLRTFSTLRSSLGRSNVPIPKNEPLLNYLPDSKEHKNLIMELNHLKKSCIDIPVIIDGKEYKTNNIGKQVMPTNKKHIVCTYSQADKELTNLAIQSSLKAKSKWETLPFEDRAAIFLKAADLAATKYRAKMAAALMLGSAKNVWQAEIDGAVEMIDFWRFGAYYAQQIYGMQPTEQPTGQWNRMEYRPLEGFVLAITPFNFVAIGANLCSTPALMGNVCLWKPSSTSLLANYVAYQILMEAGLPPGVINWLPQDNGAVVGDVAMNHEQFAALHFTGSTATFNTIWKQVASNVGKYKSYPRIVGETGGKNFHFIHSSCNDIKSIVNHTIRSAFEYTGQKCSALSRMYVPSNLWPEIQAGLLENVKNIKMGQPDDLSVMMTSVIDGTSFNKIKSYIDKARTSTTCKIIAGGKCDDSVGYFIEPTIILTTDPHAPTMVNELFGPVLTIYVYPEADFDKTLELCDTSSAYALTGAIFAHDRYALEHASNKLRNAAGNFYINDKCTGSMVGQQPFGGARMSGTNDKSGSLLNYLRWVSPRSIKENFLPQNDWKYPYML